MTESYYPKFANSGPAPEVTPHDKRLLWPTRCCRCWPRAINAVGFCNCCDFNHATGKSEGVADPDYGL